MKGRLVELGAIIHGENTNSTSRDLKATRTGSSVNPDAHRCFDSILVIGKGAFEAFQAKLTAEDAARKAAAAKVRADRDALLNPNEDDEAPADDGDGDEEKAEENCDFGGYFGTFPYSAV